MAPSSREAFTLDEWHGEVNRDVGWGDPEDAIRLATDPSEALETVHWGRNYLYRSRFEVPGGDLEAVVKQFRNQGLKRRLDRRLRGSKAERSWRRAWQFQAAGVPTATPLLWIESSDPEGPSFFVTRHLPDMIEARYLLRARNTGEEDEHFPGFEFDTFFESLGRGLRRMHEAGLFHRDLSIGNVLVPRDVRAPSVDDVHVIDLNRARSRDHLGLMARSRDLCRLAIERGSDRRRFFDAYWHGEAPAGAWLLYRLSRWAFLAKIGGKKKVRAPFRHLAGYLPRSSHAHLERAPEGAGARDKIVWDHLSDQPHQHAGRLEKTWVRLLDTPSQARHLATGLFAAPRILRRYRRLHRELLASPVPWPGAGLCVRPFPEAPEEVTRAVDDLGVRHVLLRLHPWQEEHDEEETLARELHGRGLELVYSLPQNRDLVRDPDLWRRRVAELGERFVPYGRVFQVGQAINRSKWGVWRYGEYLRLARLAASELRRHEGATIFGPAVIDFEPHATAAVVNDRGCPPLDGLASLLYVDRRGAPEGRQAGFDTLDKALLCRAIAETSRRCAPRSWVTEVNWPLWEGPHSPAGKSVSVSEEAQADYLARYYLWTLATGAAERVYWWQLIARGYGLVSPRDASAGGGLRRRPAFTVLKTLESQLSGMRCERWLPTPEGCHLLRFGGAPEGETEDGDEGALIVGWSSAEEREVDLPAPVRGAIEQDGTPVTDSMDRRVRLGHSVRYFRI